MTKRRVTDIDRLVARNIKRIRMLYGMNRRTLEEKAGIAYGILDQIEAFHKPAGKTIQMRIARVLDCPVAELYKDKSPMVKESTAPSLTSRQRRLLSVAEHLTDKELEEVIQYMSWLHARR